MLNVINVNFPEKIDFLKKASTNCFQIVSKYYIFCVNFYAMFVLLSNIFIFCIK